MSSNIRTVSIATGSSSIAISDRQSLVYVPSANDNSISVIRFPRVIATIRHGSFNYPLAVATNPSNDLVYVANRGTEFSPLSNTVSIIERENVINTIQVGNMPYAIAYNPDNNCMYVANYYSESVSVIDSTSNSVRSTVQVGIKPHVIAYNPLDRCMYVITYRLSPQGQPVNKISIINGDRFIEDIDLGAEWSGTLTYSPTLRKMCLPGPTGIRLMDVDPANPGTFRRFVYTIPSSERYPWGIAYNPRNTNMYVTNAGSNNVSIINGTSIVDTINLGRQPYDVAYYRAEQKMLVVSYNEVSLIN
jgi:YVTN family beta-propeller protein